MLSPPFVPAFEAIFDLLPAGSAAREAAMVAYVDAVRKVWLVSVPAAALAGIVAVFVGTEKLKKVKGVM